MTASSTDNLVAAFQQNVKEMRGELHEMRQGMAEIAKAVTKLAVLEERHSAVMLHLDRLNGRFESMERRMKSVEDEQLKFVTRLQMSALAIKVFWCVLGGGALFLGKRVIELAM
ncbi:hypothetical protein [Cupriavidus campinensis]|uniref:DUF1640 domain-containing protein n=1 Tax=Cupriavidus campinensis TaxID=151783 RepID=A0ABY3ESM8_9BURK|nr:hypothetical protein [Cupriavidus campinensis]TSP13967.1 hypothetical protein FGG12_05710 [Cupriavidus campinensis]